MSWGPPPCDSDRHLLKGMYISARYAQLLLSVSGLAAGGGDAAPVGCPITTFLLVYSPSDQKIRLSALELA